jgi:hypothetical protein
MGRKFFAGRDLLWVLGLCLALFFFHFFTAYQGEEGKQYAGKKYAEITVNGQLHARVPLDGEERRYNPLPAVQIAVQDGAVGFVSSDCPDKVCIHFGFLRTPGQSAVCLPNKVVVRVALNNGDTPASEEETLDSVIY